jgi:hypothetical protein
MIFLVYFSCKRNEISKICSYSGNAAMTLRVLLELIFGEFQPFFLGETQTTRAMQKNYGKLQKEFREFL